MSDDVWPYCPNCGAELESPAGKYHEWTTCPNCGEVHVEFHKAGGGE